MPTIATQRDGTPRGDRRIIGSISRILVDASDWPIVLVKFPSKFEDADLLQYLEQLRAFRTRGAPYVLVVDISTSQPLTPKQRKLQAAHIAEDLQLPRLWLKAVAFVAPTAIHQGILTAIYWLQKPPVPKRVFTRLGEAVTWARSMLTAAKGTNAEPDP